MPSGRGAAPCAGRYISSRKMLSSNKSHETPGPVATAQGTPPLGSSLSRLPSHKLNIILYTSMKSSRKAGNRTTWGLDRRRWRGGRERTGSDGPRMPTGREPTLNAGSRPARRPPWRRVRTTRRSRRRSAPAGCCAAGRRGAARLRCPPRRWPRRRRRSIAASIILPITPPVVFAEAIRIGSRPSFSAVIFWRLPNSTLLAVSEPVNATPSQPSSVPKIG